MCKSASNLFKGIGILVLSFMIFQVSAQRPFQRSLTLGWADDDHFLKYDSNNVVVSVDIKTGLQKPYAAYHDYRKEISDTLPKGFSMGFAPAMSTDQKSVVLSKDKDLWYFRLGDKEPRKLTSDEAEEMNPRFSPDDKKIAFTRNKDLYVIDLASDKETRLTFDATDRIYNGWASWVYYEEILGRPSRYAAFWWSPDATRIAYLHTDDNPVPNFTIARHDEEDGIHGTYEVTPYPYPGDPNPRVKMGIVDITSTNTVWVKTDESIDQYIAWPSWTPDNKKLMVQVVNRDQNDIRFILANAGSGEYVQIYQETRPTWVDFFEDVYVMKDGSGFLLRSCKSDWHNLYYYDWTGKLKSQITSFNWEVNNLIRLDEKNQQVYFAGTGGESTENHAFRVGLNGKKLVRLTTESGSHSIDLSPNGKYFLDIWSGVNTPNITVAKDKNGRKVRDIEVPKNRPFDPAKNARSELVRIPSTDGFMLPAIITYPLNFDETQKYPVVFTVYGGPDAGSVRNAWQSDRPSWFAENGIVTISVDHRASGHFGKKGNDYMYRCLGKWEMVDYIEAVKWLRQKAWVDASRMGITGGSYGGYTTAMALTYGADYWTHGIAKYPVTDWRLYDNVYTERFMDTPQDNPEGYKNGSVLTWVDNYKGKLYVVHGMADDNVHTQNSVFLISRLQDKGKVFDMMFYPGGRHGWGGSKADHTRNEDHRFWMKWFFNKEE